MNITIFVYDGFTALDAVGPYEVLSRLPGATTTFVAPKAGSVRTDNGILGLVADAALADVDSTDLLLVPGGPGTGALGDEPVIGGHLRRLDETSRVTASVCTGALILGAAGILKGRRSTTHWAFLEALRAYGAEPVGERVVVDGKYWGAAGVSAGIDMALQLTAALEGEFVAQAIQLGIEYDPGPPFDTGSPAKAPAPLVEVVRQRLTGG
ncbi:MAG: DJ-1/PfpI family protein [Myxococcota bacterium]